MLDKRYNLHHTQKKVVRQWMTVLIILIAVVYMAQPVQVPISPLGEPPVVLAVEPTPAPSIEPHSEYKNYIRNLYNNDDGEKLIKIIDTCENGTWDQTRTNTNRNGTKDWGMAQINDANSKLCKGLDFRHDWKQNLECAHRVYKSQGLSAWACSHKVGVTPFYLKGK